MISSKRTTQAKVIPITAATTSVCGPAVCVDEGIQMVFNYMIMQCPCTYLQTHRKHSQHIPCAIHPVATVTSLTAWVVILVAVMTGVAVAVAVVIKVLVYAGVVVNIAVKLPVVGVWATEPLSDVVTGTVVVLEFVVPVSYFVEVLSNVLVEALLAVGIGVEGLPDEIAVGVEVLADVNVNLLAAVINALDVPMSIPSEEISC